MRRRRTHRSGLVFMLTVGLATGWLLYDVALATETRGRQATVLADLAAQITTCSIRPCLGDEFEELSTRLQRHFVTDGIFYYSDLNVAYPSTNGALTGLLEWDEGAIYFKIVKFQSSPASLIHELEQSLSGCEMEQDDEHTWSCMAKPTDEPDEVLVEVFCGPDLVLLELSL